MPKFLDYVGLTSLVAKLNSKIDGKADKSHTHTAAQVGAAPASHTHDDRYFTETEMNSKLAAKANMSHTHTKSQITDFPAIPSKTSDLINDSNFSTTKVTIVRW